jgi:hypothetical protein
MLKVKNPIPRWLYHNIVTNTKFLNPGRLVSKISHRLHTVNQLIFAAIMFRLIFYPTNPCWNSKHILPSMNYFNSDMSNSTNTLAYFNWKTVIYIYVCRHNLFCQIRAGDNPSTCTLTTGKLVTYTFTTGKSVTLMEHR